MGKAHFCFSFYPQSTLVNPFHAAHPCAAPFFVLAFGKNRPFCTALLPNPPDCSRNSQKSLTFANAEVSTCGSTASRIFALRIAQSSKPWKFEPAPPLHVFALGDWETCLAVVPHPVHGNSLLLIRTIPNQLSRTSLRGAPLRRPIFCACVWKKPPVLYGFTPKSARLLSQSRPHVTMLIVETSGGGSCVKGPIFFLHFVFALPY